MAQLKLITICVFGVIFNLMRMTCHGQSSGHEFKWPGGAQAALCLTYDDGLPSHIYTVATMLNRYTFKGTFFPTLAASSINNDLDKWKSLARDGHELGNHTIYHPCRKSEKDMEWVK